MRMFLERYYRIPVNRKEHVNGDRITITYDDGERLLKYEIIFTQNIERIKNILTYQNLHRFVHSVNITTFERKGGE